MYSLYDYFRSTASYRVRIVLNLKNIPHHLHEIHLVNNGGEQLLPTYQVINPQKLVPCLKDNKNQYNLSQSLAIIDYLESKYPEPSIYPSSLQNRSLAYSLALQICCDIHPLNNLRVLKYLQTNLAMSEEQKINWYHHWLKEGFDALESTLSTIPRSENFCIDNKITIADICLIPQIYNAHRFQFDMSPYPLLNKINQHCLALTAFKNSAP